MNTEIKEKLNTEITLEMVKHVFFDLCFFFFGRL